MENLIELEDLKKKLGYKDNRSLLKWCRRSGITIIQLGKKKYCNKETLDNYLKKELSQATLLDLVLFSNNYLKSLCYNISSFQVE